MPSKWITQFVFLILWPIGMVGIIHYFKNGGAESLILAMAAYVLFATYHLLIYLNLQKKRKSGDIVLVRPNYSRKKRFENHVTIPVLLVILFVATLTHEEYGLIGFFSLPTVFVFILWLFSLFYYDLWYGLIVTNKKLIGDKKVFRLESINQITVKENAELRVHYKYKSDDIVINLKNFKLDELPDFFSTLKQKTHLEIQVLKE